MRYILQIIVVYFKVLYFSIERVGNPTPSFIFLQPSNPPPPFFGTPFYSFFLYPSTYSSIWGNFIPPINNNGGKGNKTL